jgi:hypothetical protein
MGTEHFEKRVVISGVGQSQIGRQVDRSGFQLTLDAIHAAVADAGLTMDDIDGLSMFPGGVHHTWKQGVVEGLSLPFYGAAMAVATGQARHAVIWRTVKEGSAAPSYRGAAGLRIHQARGGGAPRGCCRSGCLAWIPVTQRSRSR